MGVFQTFSGLPGISAEKISKPRVISQDGLYEYLPGGVILDGTKTRDSGNPDSTTDLRAGLIVGKVSASGKYANSVIDTTQSALTTVGTTLSLTPAGAAELARRVGTSGNLTLSGPPAANGTVATATVPFSAINLSTGAVTITATGTAFAAGSLVGDTDGSQVPVSFLPDGWEVPLPTDGVSDMPLPRVPVVGLIDATQLLAGGSTITDKGILAYVQSKLNANGKFTFSNAY